MTINLNTFIIIVLILIIILAFIKRINHGSSYIIEIQIGYELFLITIIAALLYMLYLVGYIQIFNWHYKLYFV